MGYNCCQATFGAFCDVTGLDLDKAAKIAFSVYKISTFVYKNPKYRVFILFIQGKNIILMLTQCQ